jgi:hypothetical protein
MSWANRELGYDPQLNRNFLPFANHRALAHITFNSMGIGGLFLRDKVAWAEYIVLKYIHCQDYEHVQLLPHSLPDSSTFCRSRWTISYTFHWLIPGTNIEQLADETKCHFAYGRQT